LKIISPKIPPQKYEHVLNHGTLDLEDSTSLLDFIAERHIQNILVFGSSKTGVAIKKTIGKYFKSYIESDCLNRIHRIDHDAILIATSPLHYPAVLDKLQQFLDGKTDTIILPFGVSDSLPIRVVVETQPRSGTHYTINNLMKCLKCQYASVYSEPSFEQSTDGRIFYPSQPYLNGFIVKSHFTKPLHYPQYRYVKTMYQCSFIFDAYYSWGKIHHRRIGPAHSENTEYVLKSNSKEWEILKSYIPLNKKWLDYISDKFYIRYEDFYLDFDTTKRRMATFLETDSLEAFDPPVKNPMRMYWSDRYTQFLDKEVCLTLLEEFEPFISRYWPEKIDSLAEIKYYRMANRTLLSKASEAV